MTAGERLYLLVRDEILDLTGAEAVQWKNIGVLLEDLSGNPAFSAYVKGASAIHATRRLLRFWQDERPQIHNESHYVRSVAIFIRQEVFPSIGAEPSTKIARSVVEAERACERPISVNCRTSVLGERRRHSCYLCGRFLDPQATQDSEQFLTLEHLWPTSMGGDSIDDNLMTACKRCQSHTQDTLSWEWLNVHNLVLPVAPSEQALNAVPRRIKYARHYLEALKVASLERLSLKAAFRRLGPIAQPITYTPTGLPVTFFDLRTTTD